MSPTRFTTIVIIGVGISLSTIAATRLATYRPPPAVNADDHGPDIRACDFVQYLNFRPPTGPRHIARTVRPLDIFACTGW